jgi:hypothetical protein
VISLLCLASRRDFRLVDPRLQLFLYSLMNSSLLTINDK